MIPIDVEHRIAVYFLHQYLPEDVLNELEGILLPLCLLVDEEKDLDKDELVKRAIQIIEHHLEDKCFK